MTHTIKRTRDQQQEGPTADEEREGSFACCEAPVGEEHTRFSRRQEKKENPPRTPKTEKTDTSTRQHSKKKREKQENAQRN